MVMLNPGYKRLLFLLAALALVFAFSLSAAPQLAQAQGSSGLGVGSGHGLEVGINLPALQQIRAEIAQGLYNRPCAPEEHDPNVWHTLVNVERKCHYDHHHGDDPNYVNDIFGPPGEWFGMTGRSLSYPWQTFPATHAYESNAAYIGSGRMENEAKHESYYWIVRRDQPCNTPNRQFCVKDFRVQVHGDLHAEGAATRWHSMSAEVRVCRDVNNLSTCGIIRTGGWMDHGRLFDMDPMRDAARRVLCGHAGEDAGLLRHIPLPVDTQYFPLPTQGVLIDENRCHPLLTGQMVLNGPSAGLAGDGPKAEWWAHGASDFRYQLQVNNPISNVRETAPGSSRLVDEFFCRPEDPGCRWNQSLITIRLQYIVPINSYYVGGFVRNGIVNLRLSDRRFIDRFGGLNPSCAAVGLDCIPIEYSNVHLSTNLGQGLAGFSHTPCEACEKVNYDLSPPGQQWITWFYRKYLGHNPGHNNPPTPTPSPEPQPTEPPTPEPTAPPPPAGPAVIVDVNPPSAQAGQPVSVALRLSNVADLYGLQAQCTANAGIVSGAGRADGDVFTAANSYFVDSGFQPDGSWMVAASLLAPNTPFSGSGTAFTLNYTVNAAGVTDLTCAVLAVDHDGHELPIQVINGSLLVSAPPQPQPATATPTEEPTTPPPPPPIMTAEPAQPSTVVGVGRYQNRPNNGGITVQLYAPDNTLVATAITAEDGSYALTNVRLGAYVLRLSAPQHIPVSKTVAVEADGITVDAGADTLKAGDTNDDGVVDIADATFIGANFNAAAPPAPANADMNGDALVDISDLVLVGSNYGLGAAQP